MPLFLAADDWVDSRAIGQFEDPQIRRFNCVALDLRLYGRTTTDDIPEGYGVKEAAEDLALFMVIDPFVQQDVTDSRTG